MLINANVWLLFFKGLHYIAWLKEIQRKIKNFYVELVISNIISHYSATAHFFIYKIFHDISK